MASSLDGPLETYYLIESGGVYLRLVPSKFNWETEPNACYKIMQKKRNIQIAELEVPQTFFEGDIEQIQILMPQKLYEIMIDEHHRDIKNELGERQKRTEEIPLVDSELYKERYTEELKFIYDISYFKTDLYVYSIKTDSKDPELFILLTDDRPEIVIKEIKEESEKYSAEESEKDTTEPPGKYSHESLGEFLYTEDLFVNYLGKTSSPHRGSVIDFTAQISEECPLIKFNKETYNASPKKITIYGKNHIPTY